MAFLHTDFVYNGVRSSDMGIYLVKMQSGLIEQQFFGGRQLKYEMIPGRRTPYFFQDEIQPLKVTMQLSPLDGEWSSDFKNKIARWLNNGKYNEFYSLDDTNRVYYLTYTGDPNLAVTGNNQGYIEIEFENIDCYVRSKVIQDSFDLSTITSPTVIEIANLGTENILPDVEITCLAEDGFISIINLSNGGANTYLTNLLVDEVITLDGENRTVISSDADTYRYDDFSNIYVGLNYGINRLQVSGKCKLVFRYRYLFSST